MGCFFLLSQGQVEASVRLEASVPEDAEFYVVIRGSALTHVTTAKRGLDGLTLRVTAPGMLTPDSIRILSFPLIVPLLSISIFSAPHRPYFQWSCRHHILLLHGGAGPALSGGSVSAVPLGRCPGGCWVLESSQRAAVPSELPGIPEEVFHVDSRRGVRHWRGRLAARFKCWSWSQGSGGEDHMCCDQPGLPWAVEKHPQSSRRGRWWSRKWECSSWSAVMQGFICQR